MSSGTLAEVARITGGTLNGADRTFVGVATDTRKAREQELFFALSGPNFDGHAFLAQAAAAGVAGAVVERADAGPDDLALPCVEVADARIALGALARAWRERFDVGMTCITGSNGKTSVKEMLAAILSCAGPTLKTHGNFNNDIGVPLSLLRLQASHRYAVIELGASGPGEIGPLAALAQPSVGIVTNAGPAHLEGFGSVAGVAQAKGELFAALGAGGTAVINADDEYVGLWRDLSAAADVVTFGAAADASYRYSGFRQQMTGEGAVCRFTLHTPAGELAVEMSQGGVHTARNAAAATAAAMTLGCTLEHVSAGLSAAQAASGRLSVYRLAGGVRLVDDSYNANPVSVAAAIDFIADQSEHALLVLGDMKELGEDEQSLHVQVGNYARERGVLGLLTVGPLARYAALSFGEGARSFDDVAALTAALKAQLTPASLVLVKGSRSMALERVVRSLLDAAPARSAEQEAS